MSTTIDSAEDSKPTWDFSAAHELLEFYSLDIVPRSQPEPHFPSTPENQRPSSQHGDDLGDFARVFRFLGTRPLSPPLPPHQATAEELEYLRFLKEDPANDDAGKAYVHVAQSPTASRHNLRKRGTDGRAVPSASYATSKDAAEAIASAMRSVQLPAAATDSQAAKAVQAALAELQKNNTQPKAVKSPPASSNTKQVRSPPPSTVAPHTNAVLRSEDILFNGKPLPAGMKIIPATVVPLTKKGYMKSQNSPATIFPLVTRSGEEREYDLLQKIINRFPQDFKHVVSPMNHLKHNLNAQGIHVFVDASNIYFGFVDYLKQARGIHPKNRVDRVPFSFSALAFLIERRRPVAKRVMVGSDTDFPGFEEAEDVGYEYNILEKVFKARQLTDRQIRFREQDAIRYGKKRNPPATPGPAATPGTPPQPVFDKAKKIEQGVDEILHLKMAQSLLDCEEPSTMILATGDAAEAEYSDGFHAMVKRALKLGWSVELVSWRRNTNFMYKQLAREGGSLTIVYLDDFAEELLDM